MGFGTVLKDILAERKMSIKELSRITGISLNTLYSITKRDTVNIRPDTLQKISHALNIPSSQLVDCLRQNIFETQKELEDLQIRLKDAELVEEYRLECREHLKHYLYELTNYHFNDKEIDIILSTAVLLKKPPTTE
ncbi:XRE family transcriptional regulator [Clostridium sp. OM02-18AC]|uniref:helix-turn-helix domain-containing protein n=1 Tax=Clostridium sp. OM02-18AC TaxID=2292311 RepID=UPI000E506FF7|nr:helix-turn-helix transcriptional regulator [Clostridium sp. OM02-18AC]RHV69824.1 XRE family transcriptional regulator [Clostridium sp. OM02-18AC]